MGRSRRSGFVRWSVLVVVGIVTVAAGTLVAVADDESDLVRTVEDSLDRMSGYLDGIAGDSSDGDIGYALEYGGKVRDAADKLRSLGPQSEPGQTMADKYPDWVRVFSDSAAALRQLKGAQLRVRDDKLADKCREAAARLKDEIQQLVRDDVPDAITSLPDRAERAADEPRKLQKQHEELKAQAERWRDDARRFSESHGRWSNVRGELHDGANELWELVRRSWEDSSRECADLVKGRDNPAVVEALKTLGGTEAGRKKLIEDMTVSVRRIAPLLASASSATDTREIEEAIALLRGVESSLATLERSKGRSVDAQRTFETWKRYADQLSPSLDALRELKRRQHGADRAPERCAQAVQDRGQMLAKGHRNAGREAIEFAKTLGAGLASALLAAEGGKAEMENHRRQIRLNADGEPWESVEAALDRTADGMVAYFGKALEVAKAKCGDVALGAEAEKFKAKLVGMCTKSELNGLDAFVDERCKEGGRRACDEEVEARDCPELRKRLERNKQCLAARTDIRDHCVSTGHEAAITQATNAVSTCERRIAAEC